MITLADAIPLLNYIFAAPTISKPEVEACIDGMHLSAIAAIMDATMGLLNQGAAYSQALKIAAKEKAVPLKELFWFVRLALTGKTNGPAIHELVDILGADEARVRLQALLDKIR